jgi:hypothetical protein
MGLSAVWLVSPIQAKQKELGGHPLVAAWQGRVVL